MITTLKLWFSTIKTTFTNLGALAVYAVIYVLLLATFFKFIWTREATVWQVFITYSFMVLIPSLFFIFQAAIIDRVRDGKFQWRLILIDAVKCFIVTIPILLIGWLVDYLLTKWQLRYPAPITAAFPLSSGPPKPAATHWPSILIATLRLILLGVTLPLAAIQLWIAVAGGEARTLFAGGAGSFFRRIGTALARVFAFESVLIYALGAIVFFFLPYFIIHLRLSPNGYKTALAGLILQLLLACFFNFIGWLVTISALVRNYNAGAPDESPDPVPVPMEMVA